MRISFRLIVSLVSVVLLVAGFSAYFQATQEGAAQRDELGRRSRLLAEPLSESVESALTSKDPSGRLQRLVKKFGDRERVKAIAIYGVDKTLLAVTPSLSSSLPQAPGVVSDSLENDHAVGAVERIGARKMYVYSLPINVDEKPAGALLIFHDIEYIQAQLRKTGLNTFFRVVVQMGLIVIVTLLIIRWSIMGPIAQMAEWMKQLRAGDANHPPAMPSGFLAPIAKEVTTFAQHLTVAKSAAEEEARLRQAAESLWTPERLKENIRVKMQGRPLLIVSNREPYMHEHRGRKIECIVPAGGLVTALDPVLRSCGGTWVAHGSGDADFEVVDENNRLKVPPEDPLYTLKRVALTKEEENGYYYGFSNEGLWPLCHIAHTRPIFRAEDWVQYQSANKKFALAALEELKDVEDPCILIQDYHFALLPRLLKQERPDARIALFWHIPWPNAEAFGICPWQKELLYGMLGADLVSFHTQFHCNNFIDTVDRAMESRVDLERFTVIKEGHATLVKPFPISVAFPSEAPPVPGHPAPMDRVTLLKETGLKVNHLAVGVERMDYTKGILERFRAVERFLEKYPKYQGDFALLQIGAPSRTHIKRYHDFIAEVESEAERINWKFKARDWRPIVFLKKHHSHEEILPYYKNADVCLVTSIHDGMNLVAKEFVVARGDNDGVLILSRFAGASRELRDALIVNPYDIEQMADAIQYALEMAPEEKSARMRRMRDTIRENNIYRWAGNLIEALADVQIRRPVEPKA